MSANTVFLYGKITRRLFAIFFVFALLPVSVLSWIAIGRISEATDKQVSQVLENEVKNYSYLLLERLEFAEQSLKLYQADLSTLSAEALAQEPDSYLAQLGLIITLQPLGFIENSAQQGAGQRLSNGQLLMLVKEGPLHPLVYLVTAIHPQQLGAGLVVATLSPDYILRAEENRDLSIDSCILGASSVLLFATTTRVCNDFLSATGGAPGHKGEARFRTGDNYFSRYRSLFLQDKFGYSEWKIAIIQPEHKIFSASVVFKNNFLITALGVILSLSLVSIYFIRTRMAPLASIMAGIQRVSEKQYDQPVDISSGDEFQELAEAFNSMSSQVSRQLVTMASMSEIDQLILTRIKKEDIIQVVLEKTGDVIPSQAIGLAIFGEKDSQVQVYRLADSGGADLTATAIHFNRNQLRSLQDGSLWLNVVDAGNSDLFANFADNISRLHLLPVYREQVLVAVILLGYFQLPVVDEESIATSKSYADRIAVALGNAEWEERLYHQAHYDVLTNLPNRLSLLDSLNQSIKLAERSRLPFAVLFFDLDDFKLINDSLGHGAGDQMIAVMAQRLQDCMRAGDTVARMGGDEFVIVSSTFPSMQAAVSGIIKVANKMMEVVATPLQISEREIRSSSSIGIALYPRDGTDSDTLLKNADAAMYHAKDVGRGNFQFFSKNLNAESVALMSLTSDIKRAVEINEFELHYQPKVAIPGNKIVGAEALIRWLHPERGLVTPGEFIDVAERMGLISAIGDWTLHEACRQIAEWRDAGISIPRVSVNLSAIQIHQEDILAKVQGLLDSYQLDPAALEIEIVEGVLVEDMAATSAKLTAIRELGVHISIDDYGTGYSSLSYMKSFPVDSLKIDRCFITNICDDLADRAIVASTIVLAHNLNMQVIAEGVEKADQLALLVELGCDQIQGFFFSRPLPAQQFAALLGESVVGTNSKVVSKELS